MNSGDTIFALSSGSGKAGVAVFRVSGPAAIAVVKTISGRKPPMPRKAVLRTFMGADGCPIDQGLLLFFKGPSGFTGEDSAEFHTHGSAAVIEAMGEAFLAAGARQAGPGEFTRRAFDNGKMDLTEAEGLADLIDAETEGQRRQAYRQMEGGLKDLYLDWREGLIDALASIEGDIDFPDEQDVPDDLSHKAFGPINTVLEDIEKSLADSARGQSVRRGIHVAIIGPPNAGKSSLLNRLSGRDAAIVSDEAGTTRDVIDVNMIIAGLPVTFSDTAGIRQTDNKIEAEGVRRAVANSREADLRIGVISPDTDNYDETIGKLSPGDLLILNKSDQNKIDVSGAGLEILKLSALTGEGFEALTGRLEDIVQERFSATENAGLTRARHRDCAKRAAESLKRAKDNLATAPELAGDDVRAALHAIKELAGEADIEAVLGAIFSRFCIGK